MTKANANAGVMDMQWLEDFLAVADSRNFTRAARSRNISQAAFSRRIKALETWLGVPLIDRASFPPQLTEEGERFREKAAAIVQHIANARLNGSNTVSRRQQIGVGLPHSLATGRLPAWWRSWSRAVGQGATCTIVSGEANEIVAALIDADVDIVILYQSIHTQGALPEDQYDCIEIGMETLAPYASPALADRVEAVLGAGEVGGGVGTISMLGYTRASTLAAAVDAILGETAQSDTWRVVLEAESTSVLRAMAVAGHGVAWLPGGVAAQAGGTLRRIEGEGLAAEMKIVAHRNKGASLPALTRLWTLLSGCDFQA